jgi:ribosomal protein S18 acetylase RimI-like enzyme
MSIEAQTLWLPPGLERTAEESWPLSPASDQRSKGFYPDRVTEESDIAVITEAMEAEITSGAQKVNTRAVVDFGVLRDYVQNADEEQGLIEVAFPLSETNKTDENGLWIAYFGLVDPQRADQAVVVDPVDIDLIWGSKGAARESSADDAELVDVFDEHELEDLGLIYAPTFDMDMSAVSDMVHDPRMQLVARRVGGRIVSAAAYYRTAVTVNGVGEIKFAEVTEAATHPEHTGNGHYTACAQEVVRRAIADGADVVFGECNGSDRRVHSAARNSGRNSARLAAHAVGLQGIAGYLQSVVPISGEMRNLFPAYLATHELQ